MFYASRSNNLIFVCPFDLLHLSLLYFRVISTIFLLVNFLGHPSCFPCVVQLFLYSLDTFSSQIYIIYKDLGKISYRGNLSFLPLIGSSQATQNPSAFTSSSLMTIRHSSLNLARHSPSSSFLYTTGCSHYFLYWLTIVWIFNFINR